MTADEVLMLGTGVAGVSVGGGAEGGTVECVGWGVGVGRFDAVGFRMFPFWFSDCWGLDIPGLLLEVWWMECSMGIGTRNETECSGLKEGSGR